MDLSDRRIILGCCGGLGLLTLLLVAGGCVAYRTVVQPNLPVTSSPPSIEAEWPSVGADLPHRSVFFEHERLGAVSDIAIGDFDEHSGTEIAL